ncbi:MAG: hypothetical protein S4CHLAM81_10760 [Chlamydiales bacterium]|nr:hypothetical protein [Chlamydiales bacterium]MCH9635854.1 hypothetical protein [Chlamydiales bacterium]
MATAADAVVRKIRYYDGQLDPNSMGPLAKKMGIPVEQLQELSEKLSGRMRIWYDANGRRFSICPLWRESNEGCRSIHPDGCSESSQCEEQVADCQLGSRLWKMAPYGDTE